MKPFDLPELIALFPLPGAVLMPRGRLPLHIFEPRYLQMLEDALKTPERLIGMIQNNEDGTPCKIGNAGRIVDFSELDDGRYMITLAAVSRFRLLEVQDGFTPYLRGRIDWQGFEVDRGDEEEDPGFDRELLLQRLKRFFEVRSLDTDWDTLHKAGNETLINALSMMLPFEPGEKQALLEARTLGERRKVLVALLDFALASGDQEDRLQ